MPRITVIKEWQQLPLQTGTIDNIGVVPVEISTNQEDSITIHPKRRFSFDGAQLYIRSMKQNTSVSLVDFGEATHVSNADEIGGVGNEDVADPSDIDSIFSGTVNTGDETVAGPSDIDSIFSEADNTGDEDLADTSDIDSIF